MTRVFVEVATAGRSEGPLGPWEIERGEARRGRASCNLRDRVLEVPLGLARVDRIVRAHELMHARVSPQPNDVVAAMRRFPLRVVECAEEFRVNCLLDRAGFDLVDLCDGTERSSGIEVNSRPDWTEAVCFYVAVLGTGGAPKYLQGVRRGNPEWAKTLVAMGKVVLKAAKGIDSECARDTSRSREGLPRGYVEFTWLIASLMTRAIGSAIPFDTLTRRQFVSSLRVGGRRHPSGQFAALVVADLVETPTNSGTSGRRRMKASTQGRDVRYVQNLYGDPQRRILAKRGTHHGGVILIDISGSMDLEGSEIDDIIRLCPRAVVLAYSHRPGDLTGSTNAWLVARQGLRAPQPPRGNVGNGVDGPALKWAVQQRRPGERIVWVTDGQVTDSNDRPSELLTDECARLVISEGIRLVRLTRDVGPALKSVYLGGQWHQFGRVGARILQMTGPATLRPS